jgi:hypothetical protein
VNGEPESKLDCVERAYYGTNDLLLNGRNYFPYNTRANGHPYYRTEDFREGTLYVKGRIFDSVLLNYNLERDQVILHQERSNSTMVQVVLSPTLIDSFEIDGALFIRKEYIPGLSEGSDFLRKIYGGKSNFYEMIHKIFLPVFTEVNPHGRYSDPEKIYFLENKRQEVVKIKTKRNFLKTYSDHKSEVKRFLKKESIRFKSATDEQLVQLMKYCDELED